MAGKRLLIVCCLLLIVGVNFYLYRPEFKVLIDPNDNVFQYALVDEAKVVWKNIFSGKLSPFYLFDSWNERWAEGFSLSNYYSHLPQAILGLFGGYKLFIIVRTLMLILLPLMFFWGGTILKLPLLYCFIVALLSQTIFTDGLYGIDVSSFIWRGWGLSAQLMAVFFLPPAFSYAVDYLENKRNLGKAILFNFLVAQAHFGMFSLLLLGYPLYLLIHFIEDASSVIASEQSERGNLLRLLRRFTPRNDNWGRNLKTSIIFLSLTLFSLSYFIAPFFLQSQYRNFSVWDPIWKFDSWGIRQVIVWFLNGELFDFGRLPIITLAVVFGVFMGFSGKNKLMKYIGILFVFYFVLFFGRTTFGKLIDFVPGFSEYHLHRMIVMVQFTGILLASYLVYEMIQVIKTLFKNYACLPARQGLRITNLYSVIGVILLIPILWYLEKPLINYAKNNAIWIERSNKAYLKDLPDYEKIKNRLAKLPKARVYVGRPGNWGRNFTVGEVPLYMVLSQDGFAVIGFLPQSWSPNSDQEEFFDENKLDFYNLYNAGYVVYPDNIKPPEFAGLIAKEGKYNLFKVKTGGWFDAGRSNIAVKAKKTDPLNLTRIWFYSKFFREKDFPKIDLSKSLPDGKRWYIRMTDLNNFINLNDGLERNIWQANPFADSTTFVRSYKSGTTVIKDQQVLVNGYKAQVEVKEECGNCIVVLKQSFHPNWQVRLNGEKVRTFPVFPFYIGVEVEKPGKYEVLAEYKPGNLKSALLIIEIVVLAIFIGNKIKKTFLRKV